MFFKNVILFRFPTAQKLDDLEAGLEECQLKPVGPLELSSRGFISPFGRDSEVLAARQGDMIWMTVGGEDKILPAAVVNDLLAKKLHEIQEKEGRTPGGRTRRRIKDELVTELLPKAFVAPSRTDAYIDHGRGFIAIDTSSRKVGENVVSEVRRALGSFPALPLNAEVAPRAILTGWLSGEALPQGFSLGDSCELQDPADKSAKVSIRNMELQSDEVAKHLEAGKQCTRLALSYNDHVSFVFGEDLVIRKLKLLDGAVDSLENTERDDIRAELDARFALLAGELGVLFDALATAFKLSAAETDAPAVTEQRKFDDRGTQALRKAVRNLAKMASHDGISSVTISTGDRSVTLVEGHGDELYPQAVAIVRQTGRVSISSVQRHLQIGYNRAARLIEAMETAGIVSAPAHNGDRTRSLRQEGSPMHMTNRSALLSAVILGLSAISRAPANLLNAIRASQPQSAADPGTPARRRSKAGWGNGKKRYVHINSKDGIRTIVGAGTSRPAAKFLPNVPGMRYEQGQLIPRDAVTIQPARKKQKQAKPAKPAPQRKRHPSGGYMRNDFKGIARAARRAGVISARQQRKIHKRMRRYPASQVGLVNNAPVAAEVVS